MMRLLNVVALLAVCARIVHADDEEHQSDFPSLVPVSWPTDMPSDLPSTAPSDYPSSIPSDLPSVVPSASPSDKATEEETNQWLPVGVFAPHDRSFGFGEEIDMSRDGTILAALNLDQVEVYARSNSKSREWDKLGGTIPAPGFLSLELSPDGQRLMVHTSSSIKVLSWDGMEWTQLEADVPKNFNPNTFASMSGDGQTVAVGYPGLPFDFYWTPGFVEVFALSSTGSWIKIFRVDADSSRERNIGSSVSLSEDGTILAFAGRGTNESSNLYVDTYNTETKTAIGRRYIEATSHAHAMSKLSDDGKTLFVGDPREGMKVYRYERQNWLSYSAGLPDNYVVMNMDISSDGEKMLLCNQNERRAEVYKLKKAFGRSPFWEKTIDFHQNSAVALVGRDCTIAGDGLSLGTAGWFAADFSVGAVAFWELREF